tara:strand:- start:1254 stop:1361 length:108 start_codon:yes stop_codon:yes gene_type:complete
MEREVEILDIMKEMRCTWEEAAKKRDERKSLSDFF